MGKKSDKNNTKERFPEYFKADSVFLKGTMFCERVSLTPAGAKYKVYGEKKWLDLRYDEWGRYYYGGVSTRVDCKFGDPWEFVEFGRIEQIDDLGRLKEMAKEQAEKEANEAYKCWVKAARRAKRLNKEQGTA